MSVRIRQSTDIHDSGSVPMSETSHQPNPPTIRLFIRDHEERLLTVYASIFLPYEPLGDDDSYIVNTPSMSTGRRN